MTNEEINILVKDVLSESINIYNYNSSDEKLAEAINKVPREDLEKCWTYYIAKSGIIVDIRKALLQYLLDGNKVTKDSLHAIVDKHKIGKERQFKVYNKLYSIFYPILTIYGHAKIRNNIEIFISTLISDLNLRDYCNSIYNDFQGARQLGSERLWLAIYNKSQPNQSTSLQFFVDFFNGNITYGIYKHKTKSYISNTIQKNQLTFDYNKLLTDIKKETHYIINDNYKDLEGRESVDNPNIKLLTSPLNQILYGPPGTGKTYHTINKAVQIANPEFDISQPRAIIKAEYKRLVDAGQIVFTTFHQSMSYEDFVEGIKPVIGNESSGGQINYAVEDGIFKSICQQASFKDVQKDDSIDWGKKDYFKLSLGGIARPDVHDYCLDHNMIALGYGGENDLSDLSTITDWHDFKIKFSVLNPEEYKETTYSAQAAFTFLRMKIGDVVVISKGNRIVDAVGIVESDYYYDDNVSIDYRHFRKVKWLSTRMNYKPDFFLDVNISQMTIYEFYKHSIKVEAFKELFSSKSTVETSIKPHVLIIDEINRGNVSAIFGELITLIEDSKREDQTEALEVILPYSKEKFSVPPNLYIIGTMNTADRSVEALDTALRRRFVFEELLPNPDLEELDYIVFEHSVSDILKRINLRIEKLIDRDHCIGHAYFIGKDEETIIDSFYKNIIPLLQEYFFGDYGKIGLVLGSGFVQRTDTTDDIFAQFDYEYREDLASRMIYQIIDYRMYDDKEEGFKAALDLLMK